MVEIQNAQELEKVSIDDLSKKIKETTEELDQLKNGLSKFSIEQQNCRLSEIENAILECSQDLFSLEQDGSILVDKKQLEELKLQIDKLRSNKEDLKKQIETQTNIALTELNQSVTETTNGKDKKWIGKQWDALTSKEEWKQHTGKNIVRALGGVGIVGGAVWLGKKIFGRKAYEDEIEGYDNMTRKEKRKARKARRKKQPFWQRPLGKIIKWGGVGLGVYGLGKRFGRRGKEGPTGRDSDKEKFDGYEEEIVNKPENKEKFNNYESLGGKVDDVYRELYGRELQSGYEDELAMQRISEEQSKGTKFYKGIVPYCLDNQYKTVEGILGQNSSFKTALNDGLDGMVNFVKNAGANFLKMFAESYLEYLPSRAPFKNAAGSLSERIDQWKIKNENAEKEMQYFFRQSIRVQTYLFQKKDQLIKKLVKEASLTYGISEDDIYNNEDKFKKYIEKNPQYQNFMNSPTHSAVMVLDQNNLFDNNIDEDVKNHVIEIDKDRDRILGCKNGEKDIIETINDKKGKNEQLDSNDDKKLGEACTGMLNSMDDILESAEESAWNIYGDLFRSGGANMREYLEKSGLDKIFQSYKQIISEKQQALANGQLSNEDKIALSEALNGMLALKKEAELGEATIERDYDEYGNIIYRIPGFLSGSVKNLRIGVNKLIHGEWKEGLEYVTSSCLGTGVLITATGAVLLISKTTRSAGKVVVKTGAVIATLPVSIPGTLVYKGLNHIKPVRDFGHKINPIRYRGEKGAENLLDDLCGGKMSLDRAGKIVERRSCGFFTGGAQEKTWKDLFGAAEDVQGNMKAFDAVIKKQHGATYLKDIKDSGLYDSLLSKWDVSEEIRQAVKQGKSVEELKSMVGKTSEVISDLRKAFGTKIDDAIKVLKVSNGPLEKNAIRRLENLGSKLSDDEVEAFMKIMNNGFDLKYIGHLDQLFNLKGSVRGVANKQLGEHLKDLLMKGNYKEFRRLVSTDKQVKNGLGKMRNIVANDSDFIKHMDTFFKWKNGVRGLGDDVVECIAKTFAKIFSKVL